MSDRLTVKISRKDWLMITGPERSVLLALGQILAAAAMIAFVVWLWR